MLMALQQRVYHADQHAQNQQRGGIVFEIVHGALSFVLIVCLLDGAQKEKFPELGKIIGMPSKHFC